MFDSPWLLVSGLVIGMLGCGLVLYGKKQEDLKCLAGGAVLCVFPYFVHSVLVMWAVTAVCAGLLYVWRRAD